MVSETEQPLLAAGAPIFIRERTLVGLVIEKNGLLLGECDTQAAPRWKETVHTDVVLSDLNVLA